MNHMVMNFGFWNLGNVNNINLWSICLSQWQVNILP